MSNSSDIQAGGAYVDIQGNTKPFDKAMDTTESRFSGFVKKIKDAGEGIRDVGAKMALLGGAMAAPAIAGIRALEQYGATLAKMTRRTGIGTDLAAQLNYAAESMGTSGEAVAKGVSKMERGISGGSKNAGEALQQLGLDMGKLKGESASDQLGDISDALSKVGDEGERLTIIQKVFGNSGLQMIDFLAAGREEMERLKQEGIRLGTTLQGEAAQKAISLYEAMKRLGESIVGVAKHIGVALYPIIKPLADRFVDVAIYIQKLVDTNPALIEQWAKMALNLVAVGTALTAVGYTIAAVMSPTFLWAASLIAVGVAVAAVTDELGITNTGFGELLNAVRISGIGMSTHMANTATLIGIAWDGMVTAAKISWNGLLDDGKMLWAALKMGVYGFESVFLNIIAGMKTAFVSMVNSIIGAFNSLPSIMRGGQTIGLLKVPGESQGAKASDAKYNAAKAEFSGAYNHERQYTVDQTAGLKERTGAALSEVFKRTMKDYDPSGKTTIDTKRGGAALMGINDKISKVLGDLFGSWTGKIPHNEFAEAKKVKGDFGPDKTESKYTSSGSFNAFGGGQLGADGTFTAILSEAKQQSASLREIAGNTGQGGGGGTFAGAR